MAVRVEDILSHSDPEGLLDEAGRLLSAGELVVLPTETVYGVAGRLDRPETVAKLRELRQGATGPFTVHVADAAGAAAYLGRVPPLGRKLMHKLWPGPVALVFDVEEERRVEVVERLGVSEQDVYAGGRVTLRCPSHFAATHVLGAVDAPVALTRIETAAGRAPWDEAHRAALPDSVALVIDAGPTRFSKPSTIVRADPAGAAAANGGYEVLRAGVFDERIIAKQMQTTILFVCSGNTCRSPMASAVAKVVLARRLGVAPGELEARGINVVSAGSFAVPGLRATPQAVDAVAALGGDLTSHRSRALSHELINGADVIFTMGRSHSAAVVAMSAAASRRVLPLDPDGEIEDPIGGDLSLYSELARKFVGLIERRLEETVLPDILAK